MSGRILERVELSEWVIQGYLFIWLHPCSMEACSLTRIKLRTYSGLESKTTGPPRRPNPGLFNNAVWMYPEDLTIQTSHSWGWIVGEDQRIPERGHAEWRRIPFVVPPEGRSQWTPLLPRTQLQFRRVRCLRPLPSTRGRVV